MIVGYSAAPNVWVRSAICWVMAFLVLTFDFAVMKDVGPSIFPEAVELCLVLSIVGGIVLWVIGRGCGECNRVIVYVFIFGSFGVLPLLTAFAVTCSLSLFFLPVSVSYVSYLALILLAFFWVIFVKRVADRGAIVEKALKSRGDFLILNRLHVFSISHDGGLVKVGRRANIFLLSAAGVWLSYTLQHKLKVSIGDEAVFFCISLVGAPYAVWCVLRFSGGAYIWIWVVARIERNLGKLVIFHSDQMSFRLEQKIARGRNQSSVQSSKF